LSSTLKVDAAYSTIVHDVLKAKKSHSRLHTMLMTTVNGRVTLRSIGVSIRAKLLTKR
jgi:hypothetical protein